MVEIRGTHGTCVSRAEQIVQQGTMAKGPGRVGIGAYFWTAVNDSEPCRAYAGKLATGWALRASRQGQYRGERDQGIAIVHTVIAVEEDDYISLDDPQFLYWLRDFLGRRLMEHYHVDAVEKLDASRLHKKEDMIHGIIEAFVAQLEENLGTAFKVIFKSVQANKCIDDPLLPFIGNPNCFAVRDTAVIRKLEITKI
ncbi:hypothetical protein ACN429_23045 [Pseudomonas oryzihabitans]|uniref:hypothetical protein n=1 Tax=Pseudomonas oryzihabitans TaxID=47885 RepID=UPI0036430A9D